MLNPRDGRKAVTLSVLQSVSVVSVVQYRSITYDCVEASSRLARIKQVDLLRESITSQKRPEPAVAVGQKFLPMMLLVSVHPGKCTDRVV